MSRLTSRAAARGRRRWRRALHGRVPDRSRSAPTSTTSGRVWVRVSTRAAGRFCAAATASPTTPDRTRRSRGSSSRSRRFRATQTVIGRPINPLHLQDALLSSTSTTTNNWGVDKDYTLGTIQTWNATMHARVSIARGRCPPATPARRARASTSCARRTAARTGCSFPTSQAFIWESSGGHSILQSGTVQRAAPSGRRARRRRHYTLAKSFDNASSLGAGGTVVAQNDKDLDAEWALSSFDRRHAVDRRRLSGSCRSARTGDGWPTAGLLAAPGRRMAYRRPTARFSRARRSPLASSAPRATCFGATTDRCARTTPAADIARRSDDRRVLQHRGLQRSGRSATFGNSAAQHDHRPRRPPAERVDQPQHPPAASSR